MTDILNSDIDSQETSEWLEALEAVIEEEGTERAHFLLEKMIDLHTVEIFLAKKIRQGVITLAHLEKIEGINIIPIIEEVAKSLHVEYVDLDDIEIDMRLFSKVSYIFVLYCHRQIHFHRQQLLPIFHYNIWLT